MIDLFKSIENGRVFHQYLREVDAVEIVVGRNLKLLYTNVLCVFIVIFDTQS